MAYLVLNHRVYVKMSLKHTSKVSLYNAKKKNEKNNAGYFISAIQEGQFINNYSKNCMNICKEFTKMASHMFCMLYVFCLWYIVSIMCLLSPVRLVLFLRHFII